VQSSPLEVGDSVALGPDVALRLDAPDKSIGSLLQEMHRDATKDALTGMLNRRSFMDRLQQECSATSRHALATCVAMLDVDHFKKINDTYGHPAGDAVLVELARRLHATVRTEDVAARFGGEEFVLMLPMTQLEGGRQLLERVRLAVSSEPFTVPTPRGEQTIPVTLSAGLAHVKHRQTPEQVLETADVCLYQAKHSGRNRVVDSSQLPE
jgi:diguanylate cyclase (GGDEF)-like protein